MVLVYADGSETLSEMLGRVGVAQLDSADDARSSIMNVVPVERVGEPGQSDGDG